MEFQKGKISLGGIVNKDLQKIQALMMLQMRLGSNMSYKEIAQAMNVHPETVERRMIFAEKAGLFLDLEKEIITKIVPKAMKAIETALEDGDSETALEILKSVGVLRDRKAPKTAKEEADDNELFETITGLREQRAIEEATVVGELVGRSGLAGLLEATGDAPTETPDHQAGDSTLAPVRELAEKITQDDRPE